MFSVDFLSPFFSLAKCFDISAGESWVSHEKFMFVILAAPELMVDERVTHPLAHDSCVCVYFDDKRAQYVRVNGRRME